MRQLRISGVWNDNGTITYYAFHELTKDGMSIGAKTSKAAAIKLVDDENTVTKTMLWNYKTRTWDDGEVVHVVDDSYLRSNPDNKLTDNLQHLIDYDWVKL